MGISYADPAVLEMSSFGQVVWRPRSLHPRWTSGSLLPIPTLDVARPRPNNCLPLRALGLIGRPARPLRSRIDRRCVMGRLRRTAPPPAAARSRGNPAVPPRLFRCLRQRGRSVFIGQHIRPAPYSLDLPRSPSLDVAGGREANLGAPLSGGSSGARSPSAGPHPQSLCN